ncbi:MAG: phosphotransferase family protein [Candidatus Thorarchaeota archaeon]
MELSHLQSFLQTTYPERNGLKVSNLRDITSGWETEIRSFDLEWQSPESTIVKHLVIRIFPGKWVEEKATKEFRFMKELHKLDYPVPKVYILETDVSVIGYPFIIMDRINGGTIEDRIRQSENTRSHWLDVMCTLMVDLHNTKWDSLVSESMRIEIEDPYYIIYNLLSEIRNLLDRTNALLLLPIIEWLQTRVESVPCSKPAIIHGDFHAMNVLLNEHENPIVIDWGAARVSDSRIDLAWSLLLYLAYGSMARRDDLLARYEKALGSSVKNIEYFEVIACLRRLHDIFVSINQGTDSYGLRPEAVEMMRSTIQHVINVRDRLKDLTGIVIPRIDSMIEEIQNNEF